MMYGSLLLIPVYLLMAYTSVSLYVPMAMMGIAFSLIPAVMWPSVAYVVPEQKLGTAYGLMTLIQNVGLAGFNLLIGWANELHGASANEPGRLPARDVALLKPRLLRPPLRVAPPPSRDRPRGHGLEDDHDGRRAKTPALATGPDRGSPSPSRRRSTSGGRRPTTTRSGRPSREPAHRPSAPARKRSPQGTSRTRPRRTCCW